MKSIQNKGINLTAEDLKNRIADRKERYTKQQARREKLEQTMENTRNDIEQLEYTLAQMERTAKRSRNAAAQPSRFVPRERIASFFARVSRFFDHLQHRLHRSLNYTWFCLVLCSRYTFQSRLKSVERCCLTPATVLGYFKRERRRTSDFALMVEAALGISAELLVNRQARYNMAVSLKEKSLTDKLHEIRKMCASLL